MKYFENKILTKTMLHTKIVKFQLMHQTTIYLFDLKLNIEELSKLTLKFLMEIYTVVQYSYRHRDFFKIL